MFKRFKTSTQISLKFTLFSAGILLLISLMMNLFFFFFWYFGLRKPIHPVPLNKNQKYTFSSNENFQHRELRFPINSKEASLLLDEEQFFQIIDIDDYYLYFVKEGDEVRVRNVTQQMELQILLFWISLVVVVGGTAISYLISLFFVKTALKKLNALNKALENIDIDRLDCKIEITGHPQDEINRVSQKFNQALVKIESQTRGLKDFVRNASHELKTPLMAMSSLLSLARKSKDYENTLEQIKIEIKRMDSLLDTLLLITQLEEKTQLRREKTELTRTIRSLIEQFQLQYQEKKLTLELDLPEYLEKEINPQGRNCIITNLIGNAFKFVDQEGKIKISLSSNAFQVWNSWSHISLEQREKIRERFWQAEASHSDRKSFWLGLYLAKLFADKQGFKLECESWTASGVSFLLTFS